VEPCDGGVEHDVAEPGGALVDGSDAQGARRGIGHPGTDDIADLEIAVPGHDAADRDRVATDVAERTGDDAEVERGPDHPALSLRSWGCLKTWITSCWPEKHCRSPSSWSSH
jgi:hypothetical protein